MQKVKISICLVAYKADNALQQCLQSIVRSADLPSYEIIVIDNNENDSRVPQIVKKYSNARYIRARRNGGYGAGNNLALSNARGEYVLVINPDVQVEKNTISHLYTFLLTHKKAAAVGTAYQTTHGKNVPLGTGELTPLRGVFALSFLNKFLPHNKFSKDYYLTDITRQKDTQVWAVAGSIALFRKKALIEVGGYDEQLFLYYEESDLGRRLKKHHWDLWITNKTTVLHSVGRSTKSVEQHKIKDIFIQSRRYYFKKHFGRLSALLVELVAQFGKYEATVLLITLIGTFLRFYKVSDNLVFHGELGDNYLAMKNIFMTGVVPLLGPPTSHPWLSFGPLYYWLFAPVLLLFQYSPIGMAYVFAFIHSLLILVNYWTIKELFTKKIALISSFLLAISPAFISFAHESRFFSLTLLLFYPFIYAVLRNKYFLSGLFFAMLLNFHLTPLVYVPPLIFFFYLTQEKWKFILKKFTVGAVTGSLPFIVYNALHGFEMLKQATLWIPYRVGGFLGIVPKNNLNTAVVEENIGSGYQFIKSAFLPLKTPEVITISVLVVLTALTVLGVFKLYTQHRKGLLLFISLLIFGYIAIFIHGSPPSHYYLPLYPLLLITVSLGISDLKKGWTTVLLLFVCMLITFSFYFSNSWFYQNQRVISSEIPVPYWLQLRAAEAIVTDAQGEDFSLSRVGPFDQFSENYSQNYRYLLWKSGNEPLKNSETIYTIYETTEIPSDEYIIYSEGGLTVTKKHEINIIIT